MATILVKGCRDCALRYSNVTSDKRDRATIDEDMTRSHPISSAFDSEYLTCSSVVVDYENYVTGIHCSVHVGLRTLM